MVPVLGGDGTKIAPPEDIFDQSSFFGGSLSTMKEMDGVVPSPGGAVLMISSRRNRQILPPPQSLDDSIILLAASISKSNHLQINANVLIWDIER